MENNNRFYEVDGKKYRIPESEASEFEKDFPSAKVNMSANGKDYLIGLNERREFLEDFADGNVSYTNLDAPTESDFVIESHSKNKKKIEETIARIDEEYSAKPKKEKTFWEKFSEATRDVNSRVPTAAYYRADEQREDAEKGQDYVDAKIAQYISDNTGTKINQYENPAETFIGGVAQGVKDSVLNPETWDSTIGLERAARVHSITKKLDRGEALSDGEQMIVDALVDDLASDIYLSSEFGRGYKAGKVTGESIPFMVETMLNPASKLGESITKKFGSKILKSVSNKLVGKALSAGARVAGDVAGAAIMSATTSQSNIAADAFNRLSGQVDFDIDEDGKFKFKGFKEGEDNALKAYAKAYGANTIEHFSEMVGEYFAPIGKAIGKWTKKGAVAAADAIGAKRISLLLTEMTPNGFGSALNDFIENTQWHGSIGEFGEEMISGAMNALVVGDQTMKKYDNEGNVNPNYLFDKENMIDTFLGVSIMGGVMSSAKTLGYTTPETRYNRNISEAKRNLEKHVSKDELAQLESFADNPFGVDYANLTPFFSDGRKKEDKAAIADYLKAVMEKQGYMISREASLSGTQQGMEEMNKAFKFGQNMTEADLYDVDEAEAKAIQSVVDSGFSTDTNGVDSFNIYRWSTNTSLTPEQQIALHDLAIIRNAKEGLNNKLQSVANIAIMSSEAIANNSSNNGIVTIGLHNGNKVYVKGGVKVADGGIVKPSNVSGYPVEIVDAMTGATTTVDSSEISNVANIDTASYNYEMAKIINESYQQRWNSWRSTKSAKSKLAEIEQFVGSKVLINTEKGMSEVEVQQILPNGEVLIKGKKGDLGGQSIMRVDVDSFYDSMSRDNDGNPIFNQSQFRSQTESIKAAQQRLYGNEPQTSEKKATVAEPQTQQTEEPVEQPTEVSEPVRPTEAVDYRGEEVTIIINGKPTKVEVTAQDNASDSITYEYVDEEGNIKIGNSTIKAFASSIVENTEPTEIEAEPTEKVEEPVEVAEPQVEQKTTEPKAINWDELFEKDKEAYLNELQNKFGDKTIDMLNRFISAAQSQLDALNASNPTTMDEIVANTEKEVMLTDRINTLKGMVERLTPKEEEPIETTEPTPVDVEEPIETEQPVAQEPIEEPIVETEPAAPVAPNPVSNPAAEAHKREKSLAIQLGRYGIPHEKKQDMAYNAGKAVADFFATREEYDAYTESADAVDLGEYIKDFERGVEYSFANRQQDTSISGGNSVSLGTEPNEKENEGPQTTEGNGPDNGNTSGGTDNGGNDGENQGTPQGEPTQDGNKGEGRKEAGKQIEKYPARKKNATQQLLIDTFGFAAVTIPNSRKETLNTIYDFMMEMSKMLGISPKAIGQGGWLGVSNLRGNNRAAARYQRKLNYLGNIAETSLQLKYDKLSSIAHEWWHALDFTLAFFETGFGLKSTTEIDESKFTGRKETFEAVRNVLDAIKSSGHIERIKSNNYVPNSFKNYLLEPTELGARAFNVYISDLFAKNGIEIEGRSEIENEFNPTAEEMQSITPAFDNLFKVLQEKEGKTEGTLVLYHIGEMMSPMSEASQLSTESVMLALNEGGKEVEIVDDEQTEQIISELNDNNQILFSIRGEKESAQDFVTRTIEEYKKKYNETVPIETVNPNSKEDLSRYTGILVEEITDEDIEYIKANIESRNSWGGFSPDSKNIAIFVRDSAKDGKKLELVLIHENIHAINNKTKDFVSLGKFLWDKVEEGTKEHKYKVGIQNAYPSHKWYDEMAAYVVSEHIQDGTLSELEKMLDLENINRLNKLLNIIGYGKESAKDTTRGRGFDVLRKWLAGRVRGENKRETRDETARGISGVENTEADGSNIDLMVTPNGVVYGWTDGNKIYLTKAGINPNTTVHEYTHLWAKAMMQKNPKGWNSVKSLLKGTPVWNDVLNDANYSNIHGNEDFVASEVLSRLSGADNAAKLEKMAQQMIDEAKGTMRKAEARGLIQRIKDALNEFWSWVGTELFGIEKFESIEQVTDRVLWDLMNNTDLNAIENEKSSVSLQRNENESDSYTSNDGGRVSPEAGGVQEEVYASETRNDDGQLYNSKGEGVSWDDYVNFNPIYEREGESDRQRNLRKARFFEAFETLTSDERLKFYLFTKEYFNSPSGKLKESLDEYTKELRNNGSNNLADFAELFVNDELKYREGVSAKAAAYHNMIIGARYNIGTIEQMFNVLNEDEYNGVLFDRAIKLAKRFGVSVSFVTKEGNGDYYGHLGEYNASTNSITLDAGLLLKGNEVELCQTILHELIHSVVARATIISGGRAVDRNNKLIDPQSLPKDVIEGINTLKEVYETIKEDDSFLNTYGRKNFDEMLSEISDSKFRKLLKAKNVWKQFLKGVCRILGIADAESSQSDALTEIESALDKILSSAERGELDDMYARYIGTLADGYTAEDLKNLEDGSVKQVLTHNVLFKSNVSPAEVARIGAARTYDKVVKQSWQEFQRQFQDAFQPVRIAIEAIQHETGDIPIEDYENYLLIQNQSSSRSRVEIDDFASKYYSPIIDKIQRAIDSIMASRGFNRKERKNEENRAEVYREVIQYLIAKHGLERNEYYQTHNTRKMTAAEQKKENDKAKQEYEAKVNIINSDVNLTDAERQLKIREALDEYEAALIEIKTREVPDVRDYSGLTSLFGMDSKKFKEAEQAAKEYVDIFESIVNTDELWNKINSATDKTLRHSYESGLLSRQQYNDIKSMFKFYIPLRGFDEDTAEDVYAYARFEGNRFNPAVYEAKGRTSVADDPIAFIINMAESEIAQGNKNKAKQALYNYILNRASGKQGQNSLLRLEEVWYVESLDANGNTIYTIASPNHAEGQSYEDFVAEMVALEQEGKAYKSKKGMKLGLRFQKQTNKSSHYIYLKVNGVEKAIYVNGDPKIADAVNGIVPQKLGDAAKALRDVQRVISSTFTNYSLEFTARNYFRDMIYSHINIGLKESDPAYRKKFRQNWRHNNMRSMLSMLKAYKSGELDNRPLNEDEAAFVEFMKNGGQTGYTLINSVEAHKNDLEKAIKRMQNGIEKGGIKDSTIFKATLGGVELLNEASELVTRFAAFKTSRDMGRGIVTSINDAKEVTVNFNTKGAQDGTGWMGAIARYFGFSKFFFNASVQGVQNLKGMANANKLKFCTTVGSIMAAGFFMPVLTAAISAILGGDDEDEYWNIPEYDRQNNICISLGGGKYAKIPLPIGFREVYALGDMVAALAFDKKFTRDFGQIGMDMANKVASVVLPINPLESAANGLNIWASIGNVLAPSSAQFIIQNWTNVDWKGAPLQKEYTYNENDPQWMKAFASNPLWMKSLSRWCNENINLDGDYEGLDWSPEKLDNTLSNLMGGVYSLIKKTGRSISMIWDEEQRNLSNIPLAGVIVGSGIEDDDRFISDAYYEMMEYYDSNIGYIKRRAEKFGYTLDDVFIEESGKHQPKMQDIYKNPNFDFMQEWYKGNDELSKMNRKIKKLKKQLAEMETPSEGLIDEMSRTERMFTEQRREFVNDMLELD